MFLDILDKETNKIIRMAESVYFANEAYVLSPLLVVLKEAEKVTEDTKPAKTKTKAKTKAKK